MKKLITVFLCLAALKGTMLAQTYILDDFNNGSATSGHIDTLTSWNLNTTLSGGILSVSGTAKDDNGWIFTSPTPIATDFTSFTYIWITGENLAGNLTPNLAMTFGDDIGAFQTFLIPTSSFTTSMTTVSFMMPAWTIDPTIITSWNIGGGATTPGTVAFRFGFDNITMATTAAVPEPTTYAALAGVFSLGFAAWRRRSLVRA
jgi:hypothetical protein